jgi:hypothetical protein
MILCQRIPYKLLYITHYAILVILQLKVEPRMSPDPRGHMYFKMFNNEVRYFNLDESIFKKIVETGKMYGVGCLYIL